MVFREFVMEDEAAVPANKPVATQGRKPLSKAEVTKPAIEAAVVNKGAKGRSKGGSEGHYR